MKTKGFLLLFIFCLSVPVWAQQTKGKQKITFKSIVIQNGDTVVTEKNIESDDPNANLSDSIQTPNGVINFNFGGANSNDFFKNFDPFSSPQSFNFESPFLNDSLLNQFFSSHFAFDSTFFNFTSPSYSSPTQSTNSENSDQYSSSQEFANHVSSFDVEILTEIKKVNISFKLSQTNFSMVSIENKNGKSFFSEQVEPSKGYYVRQLDSSIFEKGTYTVKLAQGNQIFTKTILIK